MTLTELKQETECSFDQVLRWPTQRAKDWTLNLVSSASRDSNIEAIVAIAPQFALT
jgi:hypothetical protein